VLRVSSPLWVGVALIRELVISTRLLIDDLAGRCGAVGVKLVTAAPATRVVIENGSVAGVALGAAFVGALRVVLCYGIGTRELLDTPHVVVTDGDAPMGAAGGRPASSEA
jgi:glycine/D-amino acid oxidase-like deaminating enzyme